MSESKTYRVKSDLVKKIKAKTMEYVLDRKEIVDEAEVVNAMILKGLETSKNEDIARYLNLREERKIR